MKSWSVSEVTEIDAGRAVANVLKAEGVRCVFGVPGGHILGIYDALYDMPEIRTFLVRHEQSAACLAAGYAQLTGQTAVCLATAGPGVTNLITGVAEAFVGSLPMVIIGGRGATATAMRGASQEVATDRILAPITKWTVRVDRADLLVDALRQAFAIARNGKPGPVLVDIPRDLLMEKVVASPYIPVGPAIRPRGEPARIAAAVEALLTAEHPIIVAGGGAVMSKAREAIVALAESLAIPVLTSLAGRGSVGDDHPLSVGGLGAHRNPLSKQLLADADVVLGFGTRFEEMETNWRAGFVPSPEATYVQVDIDPVEIGRSVPAQLSVVGDIRLVAEDMLSLVRQRGRAFDPPALEGHPRVRSIVAERQRIELEVGALARSDERPIHPVRVIRAAREVFPRSSTVAIDVGCIAQHMAGSSAVFPMYEPHSLITPSSFYGMGFAASAAPIAAIARPEQPALCFVGDGSMQMALPILPFATEYQLAVTWCVLDDLALGSIRDIQEHNFGNRILDTEFRFQPDFAALALSCGCFGERVDDPTEVEPALRRALAANQAGQAALIDFRVARARMQQTYDHYVFYKRGQP
jgi:acetolactate synthase I/II/III large subunit